MPLETTMMIIDNSEYMRNGDYHPSRFEAQADAVNAVFNTKIDSNPENSVGIMTMAGKGPEVLVTSTKDLGQILQAIHTTRDKIGGDADIPTAIAVAQLALKHRQNKHLRQRIVVFVGSPLQGHGAEKSSMDKLAKKLKKNNVAVDFIAFGDGISEDEQPVLRSFVENANSGDNSHYIAVPPGIHLLSDIVLSSPVLAGDRGIPEEAMGVPAPGGAPSAANDFEFGVDPSLDPELAMALRMSMEEEQARQAAAAAAQSSAKQAKAPVDPTPEEDEEDEDDEEAALLKQAIAMSEGRDVEMAGASKDGEDADMTEDEAIARAIEMSVQGGGASQDSSKDKHKK